MILAIPIFSRLSLFTFTAVIILARDNTAYTSKNGKHLYSDTTVQGFNAYAHEKTCTDLYHNFLVGRRRNRHFSFVENRTGQERLAQVRTGLKNEDNLKNEYELKNEDYLKNKR